MSLHRQCRFKGIHGFEVGHSVVAGAVRGVVDSGRAAAKGQQSRGAPFSPLIERRREPGVEAASCIDENQRKQSRGG